MCGAASCLNFMLTAERFVSQFVLDFCAVVVKQARSISNILDILPCPDLGYYGLVWRTGPPQELLILTFNGHPLGLASKYRDYSFLGLMQQPYS